jgi:hypothetical protein
MQAFWVIQPRRNNPIIQVEKAWNERFFLSAEDAQVALEAIQGEEWTDEEKEMYDIADCYEVVALVADWPPSQFPPEDVQEAEAEPEWVADLKEISSVVADWPVKTMQDIALAVLGTALTAWELDEMLLLELGDKCKLRITPNKPVISVKLGPAPEADNV